MSYYTKLALLELQGKEYDKDKELRKHYIRLLSPFAIILLVIVLVVNL